MTRRATLAAVLALMLAQQWAAPTRGFAEPETHLQASAERVLESPQAEPARKTGPATTRTLENLVPTALRQRVAQEVDRRMKVDLKTIRALRGEALGLLRAFVGETSREAREMPEAILRLGELEWESEREAHLELFRTWDAKPAATRGSAPEPNFSVSRTLFSRVLVDYPSAPERDLALYVDGSLASEMRDGEGALHRFEDILRNHPRSRFTADAHMFRAEHAFAVKGDFAGALRDYERVLAIDHGELGGLALFKSAWCMWRLGSNDEAARRFVRVFELSAGSRSQRQALDELQGEALRYVVEVFAEDDRNSAADVVRFLQKMGGDRYAGKVVRQLATTFYDQAQFGRGIEAYDLLLKLEPTSPDAPNWWLEIANGHSAGDDFVKQNAAYERALTDTGATGTWARTQADPARVATIRQTIETHLRERAMALHARAQADAKARPNGAATRAELEGAAGLYTTYLGRFSEHPKAHRIFFYLAELELHRLGRPSEAAAHYLAAARAAPVTRAATDAGAGANDSETLRHDALYNALSALEQAKAGDDRDRQMAEALELYAKLYPRDRALPDLMFRQGKSNYDRGAFDPAVKIFGTLLEKFPETGQAAAAGELILDSFNRAKNYETIELWARRLKAAPAFRSAPQQQRLDTLTVQSVFKQGEQKSAAGDHGGAAKAYLRAAREFPTDPRAAQACVNAGLAARRAGDLAAAEAAGKLALGKELRNRPEAPQAAWTAAATLQSVGLFAKAAEFHEAVGTWSNSRFEHTRDAMFNSVVLRLASGEPDRALSNGQAYLAAYPGSAEADEVVFQMGKAHQNAGRHREAADLYRRFLARGKSPDHRVLGHVLLALALLQLNDGRAADEALTQAVLLGKRRRGELGPEGRYAAARARYLEGERVLARFERVEIAGDPKQLARRLKQKAELLKQAASVFLDTVSMGVAEWTTAALYQIGHTYERFAQALREAPPPADLVDSARDAYTQQIEEFVVPVEERSLDAYETGWKKAVTLGIFNQWTHKMREALGRLNAELYPPLKEIGFEVHAQRSNAMPPLLQAPGRARP